MPLLKGKSKKAFSKNVESEMDEGKPQKQALAIAYSMKRKKKMASGGTVQSGDSTMNYAKGGNIPPYCGPEYDNMEQSSRSNMAQGGSVDSMMEVECPSCNHKFSHGGMVANDDEPIADSIPANFDYLALRDNLEGHYTGENSGDEDGMPDVVKRAMKKKKND